MAASLRIMNGESYSDVIVPLSGKDIELEFGRTYIIAQERQGRTEELVSGLATLEAEMVCISRMHPDLVRERWPHARIRTYWLSERLGEENITPEQLFRIKETFFHFMTNKVQVVAILDGLEYLSLYNDFKSLNILIEELNDLIMERRSMLLIPVDPRLFDPQSLARLRRFSEMVQ